MLDFSKEPRERDSPGARRLPLDRLDEAMEINTTLREQRRKKLAELRLILPRR